MSKLWQKNDGNNDDQITKLVEQFTVGNDYLLDQRLVPYDIEASIAHAAGLKQIKILTETEFEQLKNALLELQKLWQQGKFKIELADEDCHTAIERYLIQTCGEVGKKIHTGRSRNDQVLVAMRLLERTELDQVGIAGKQLATALLDFAKTHEFVPMPGYTHTQLAMLSSVGMWSAALAEQLIWALEKIKNTRRLINRCPLGTAAGYGVNFDLPRADIAKELDFDAPVTVAITVQNTRLMLDTEVTAALATVGQVCAHFANDLLLYASYEFSFFKVDSRLTTGSSIMPQKQNIDPAEIIRAEYAHLCGGVTTLRTLDHNLTSGYHRDLGRSKEVIFNSFDKAKAMLISSQLLIENTAVNEEKLRLACTSDLFAADKANDLVKAGMPFRDAYQEVGNHLNELKQVDLDANLRSKTHLGATGNLGIELLRQQLEKL